MNTAPDDQRSIRRLRSLRRREAARPDTSADASSGEVVESGVAPGATVRPARSREGKEAGTIGRGSTHEALRRQWRLVGSVALLAVGVALVLLGWWGAAHTNILTEQIPYLISGGLLGLGLIIVSGIMASSASLERENRELRREIVRFASVIRAAQPLRTDAGPSAQVIAIDAPSTDGHLYIVPGGLSYHVGGCPILEGKQGVKELSPTQLSGFAPCKLCAPDEA